MRDLAFWFMASSAALAVLANTINLLHRGVCAYVRIKRRKV